MVILMDNEEWGKIEKSESKENKKTDQKVCACGHKVCCGKHKNGQCACQQKGHERD